MTGVAIVHVLAGAVGVARRGGAMAHRHPPARAIAEIDPTADVHAEVSRSGR